MTDFCRPTLGMPFPNAPTGWTSKPSTRALASSAPIPSLVHRDLGLVFQTVRDAFTENTSIFLVDSRTEYRDLMDFLDNISPELKARLGAQGAEFPGECRAAPSRTGAGPWDDPA